MDDKTALLRHTLATLAYRGGKALRGAPAKFAEFRVGEAPRTPGQILAHIGDLLDWSLSMADGKQVGDLSVGIRADVDVRLRFDLTRSAHHRGQILPLHLPGLHRHYVLAALMNGKTDNDCEHNRNTNANRNFFPSFHDSRHCPGNLSPTEGQVLRQPAVTQNKPSCTVGADGHTSSGTILPRRKFPIRN